MRNNWKEHFLNVSGGRTDPGTYYDAMSSYVSHVDRADMLRAEKKDAELSRIEATEKQV